ncbi:MAG: carboxymuconolactone decarboxylase family protein [Armatimonadota bacterium]
MDDKTQELIAIGAAYASNCEACLAYHIREAPKYGITIEDVKEAIDIGGIVKHASYARTDDLLDRLLNSYEEFKAA